MSKRAEYVATLGSLPPDGRERYLSAESGLPGPRGNIELAEAFADVAEPERIRRYASDADEYRAVCGTVGLGRLLVEGDPRAEQTLRTLATDARWRVREGVAMALQRLGDANLPALWGLANGWVAGEPLVQRAVAAGICEPRLLRAPEDAHRALDALERITVSLSEAGPAARHGDEYRVLRQALGYCWSVATAAAPAEGFALLERWAAVDDPDIRWILRENLKKARLARADTAAAERLASTLAGG